MGEKLMCWLAAICGMVAGGLFFSAIIDGLKMIEYLGSLN